MTKTKMTEITHTQPGPEVPTFKFTITPALEPWNITSTEWFTTNPTFQGLATGTIVFNESNKILLLQRAPHDSMPNCWEVPGGAVDLSDTSIFHGAARELWEEAGLIPTAFTSVVAGSSGGGELRQVFMNSKRTKLCCRFTFVAEVEDTEVVRLDPNEHQDWAWMTEEEVRDERIGEKEVPMTHADAQNRLLEAFRLRREGGNSGS